MASLSLTFRRIVVIEVPKEVRIFVEQPTISVALNSSSVSAGLLRGAFLRWPKMVELVYSSVLHSSVHM